MKKTFVLVHGAYHGAWCWDEIKNNLEKKGHNIYALDLPGHGKDKTPREEVTFERYVIAVENLIIKNDLKDVILVGHSVGAIVISLLAQKIKERISKLVFIAGVLLETDKSLLDTLPKERASKYLEISKSSPDKSIPVNLKLFREKFLNGLTDEQAFEVIKKLTPQPFIYDQKVNLNQFKQTKIPVIYIKCLKDQSQVENYFDKISELLPKNYSLINIDSDHEPMFSHPKKLIEILDLI